MNYHTFSNLQFKPLVEILFRVTTSTLGTQELNKYFLYMSASLDLFWCLEKLQTFISNHVFSKSWLFQNKCGFSSLQKCWGRLGNIFGALWQQQSKIQFCLIRSVQLQNVSAMTCWRLLRRNVRSSWCWEKSSWQLRRVWKANLEKSTE